MAATGELRSVALGYVNPSSDQEQTGFEDQFEWDGRQWTFRLFRRGRPVHVSSEERDSCVAGYALIRRKLLILSILIFFALFFGGGALLGERLGDGFVQIFVLAVPASIISSLPERIAWRRLTRHLEARTPVGPPRSWAETYRLKMASIDWQYVNGGFVVAIGFGCFAWLSEGWDRMALLGLAVAIACFACINVWFKREADRLY